MTIINQNGEFSVNAEQYNYLTYKFIFNEINQELVNKTNFINSTWEHEKADNIFKDEIYKDKLR
jgi:hypothetical protein